MTDIKAAITIDTSGLACPMPVLHTKRALDKICRGEILEVIATDLASEADIPVLIERLGHELVEVKRAGGLLYFFIRKR